MAIDLTTFDAVLLDLDGTLYHEDHVLPGAVELVRRLRDQNIHYACLSNSTSSPKRASDRLARMGMQIEPKNIFTAGAAAVDYAIEHYGPRPRVYNLATEGVRELLTGRTHVVEKIDEPCDAVVVGAPANVFAGLERQRVALALLRNGAALIGTCADRVYPSPRGIELGSGALTHMLAYAANVQPIFCGKPEVVFFEELCRPMGVRPDRCVLIGDNPESDIRGARRMKMKTILTLTGVTRRHDLPKLPPDLQPDHVIENLLEL